MSKAAEVMGVGFYFWPLKQRKGEMNIHPASNVFTVPSMKIWKYFEMRANAKSSIIITKSHTLFCLPFL